MDLDRKPTTNGDPDWADEDVELFIRSVFMSLPYGSEMLDDKDILMTRWKQLVWLESAGYDFEERRPWHYNGVCNFLDVGHTDEVGERNINRLFFKVRNVIRDGLGLDPLSESFFETWQRKIRYAGDTARDTHFAQLIKRIYSSSSEDERKVIYAEVLEKVNPAYFDIWKKFVFLHKEGAVISFSDSLSDNGSFNLYCSDELAIRLMYGELIYGTFPHFFAESLYRDKDYNYYSYSDDLKAFAIEQAASLSLD